MRSKRVIGALVAALGLVVIMAPFVVAREGKFEFALAPVPHDPAADGGSNVVGEVVLQAVEDGFAVDLEATGTAPGLRHLMHIHGFEQAAAECAPESADTSGDGIISIGEGGVFWGPVRVSLTETGDTSPASGGALDRFPLADEDGEIHLERTIAIPAEVAARLTDHAVVLHGLDVDGDGIYDGAPEITHPVACGTIEAD
jgi:hypothetical protein